MIAGPLSFSKMPKTNPRLASLASDFSVIVIGAGPAGASAAMHLADAGIRVLLIDKRIFPRSKVCGGCVNAAALCEIDRLGLRNEVICTGGVPTRRFHWASGGRLAELPIPQGMAVSREAFDQTLLMSAAKRGVCVLVGTMARAVELRNDKRIVTLQDEHGSVELSCDVAIVAAGLAGQAIDRQPSQIQVRRNSYVGVGCVLESCTGIYEPGTVCMAVDKPGYVGITRLEGGRLTVAAALQPAALRDGRADEICARIISRSVFPPIADLAQGDWHGTMPLTSRRRQPSAARLLFVGDSAGYVEPFTGEGIGWALCGGRLAASVVVDSLANGNADPSPEWNRVWHRSIGSRLSRCGMLTRMLRHPNLLRGVIEIVRRQPWLARSVVERVTTGVIS